MTRAGREKSRKRSHAHITKGSKKSVAQLLHAPFMITLPTAYITVRYLFMGSLGRGIVFSALLTAA
jgi:hypothetical protein